MESNDRRKFIYDACSDDAIGRSSIEIIVKELGLSDKYINPSRLERPEYDDKSAACNLLRKDINRPDSFFTQWLSPTKCESLTQEIVIDVINKARSSSILWLLICLDTGSVSSAVRKTILFKSDAVSGLLKSGVSALMHYISVALERLSETTNLACNNPTTVLRDLHHRLARYRNRLARESGSRTGMVKTYQLVRILFAAMALWMLLNGKPMCATNVCGARRGESPSAQHDNRSTSQDSYIEPIVRYFKAMNTVRSDLDSIASVTDIDIQHLRRLTRVSTDISNIPDLGLDVPEEASLSTSCTGQGPCNSPGYYDCAKCSGDTDVVLTMDTIKPDDSVCMGCTCRDKGALLEAAENYLGLVNRNGRIILTGIHREHQPFTFGQLSNPQRSGGCV